MEDKIKEISRLIAYAKALNMQLNIKDNFSTRFKLQKLSFLLRILNNEDIRDFNLYTHGPYSPYEATLYYMYSAEEITAQSCEIIDEYKEKLNAVFSQKYEKIIEGTATVLYLINTKKASWKDIYRKLKEAKPNFSIGELVDSIDLAKNFVLTKEDWNEIYKTAQEESKAWERASLEDISDSL
ncbi:MAG: hypothetical protein M1284_01025 [Candidatus Parvarchaeota archaeon]|uniref:Uncharacterized protein n=1 Tax=Candidatus Parvarchaeum acidophilus ARMAN-5 TaxID=662762 RepID=D6GWN1_PARA5|nr:MAG: hypothetical protein BJBARM5_0901 [Candidatus Parvarchaeum acidophilus ARMAN-5]MCL5420316.1 hypothetical protein [Candidatus Parvarchaeota archaeon]